jgi:hypothetical protein
MLFAAVLVFLVVAFVAFRQLRGGAPAEGEPAPPSDADLDADRRPLGEVTPPALRRELLLHRLQPALGALGEGLHVVKGSRGDLRFRGTLRGHPASVDIDAEGCIPLAHLQADFPPGNLTLHARRQADDPNSVLLLLDALQVEALLELLREAKVASMHLTDSGVTATSEARLHEVPALGEAPLIAKTLAALETAVAVWSNRDAMPTPTASPASMPPPPPKRREEPAALTRVPWDETLPGRERVERATAALFGVLKDSLEQPEIREPNDEHEAEIRGRVNDVPIKLVLDAHGDWTIVAKVPRVADAACFHFDPEPAPPGNAVAGDAIRVFVAKGLYLEDTPDMIERGMRFCDHLDPSQIELLRDGMEVLPLKTIFFATENLRVDGKGKLKDIDDPTTMFQGVLDFVGWLGSDLPGATTDAGSFAQRTCSACHRRFLYGVRQPSCPNCGATT